MAIKDIIKIGIDNGWKTIDGSSLTADQTIEADVAIVGTGAGGGVTAELLTLAGFKVVMIEEGPLKSSSDFRMREREAYPQLYQEQAGRQTKDKAITIMQGRTVGGSTTVNWTSSFRTPAATLGHWQSAHGLNELSVQAMQPWFEQMEQRLSVAPWEVPPNENNDILRRGAEKLGLSWGMIRRNVKGCWNLGYCGMGCPTNAKQSMLVTTIPTALDKGATLLFRVRVERLQRAAGKTSAKERIDSIIATALSADGVNASPHRITIKAKHFVLSAGAIGTPAIMLRSLLPDPHKVIGRRTFLHPVVVTAALMKEKVEPYAGAPQTVYSDHFLDTIPLNGPMGFKLEAPPIHPILASISLPGFGADHAAIMSRLPYMQVLLSLMRDGFHEQSQGGQVLLKGDGSPVLDYPITDYVWEGARRSLLTMAELQFAAGAPIVMPLHEHGKVTRSWAECKKHIEALPMAPLATKVVSAHVMGGAAMSTSERQGVVNHQGRSHLIENLSVHDGSVFPTCIGANPQLSIYGLTARNTTALVASLKQA